MANSLPADLLRVGDLTCVGLERLVDLAARMKAEPAAWVGSLSGSALGCRFERPSIRAHAPLEVAAHRLGMVVIELDPDELPLDGYETFEQAVRLLAVQAGALLAMTGEQRTLRAVADKTGVPVLNALSDEHDPCQALGDLLTLRERFGALEGLALAYVGEPSVVTNSLMEAGALAGMDVRVACPPDRPPDVGVRFTADVLAERHGGNITVTDEPREAVTGADAVYTDVWSSPAAEPEQRRYRVTPELMAQAKPTAVFMHCLPARPGEEVSAAVINGRQSIVWDQAANRVSAEQAAIYALAGGDREELV